MVVSSEQMREIGYLGLYDSTKAGEQGLIPHLLVPNLRVILTIKGR